ncbi:hypothetical protein ACP70R_012016 [Stipagrostis hirtigluma subsp. patula]
MRAKRRLRIAPVGELRRRWAAVVVQEGEEEVSEIGKSVDPEDDEESDEEVHWSTPSPSFRGVNDPLHGQRPKGSRSRFWDNGVDDAQNPNSSPSTSSLGRRAEQAGLRREEIDEAAALLKDPDAQQQMLATSTPTSMKPPIVMARKVMTALFQEKKRSSGSWQGPLPPKRVSPPLTLGDCKIKCKDSADGHRRHSGDQRLAALEDDVQISNSDPKVKLGRSRQRNPGVWLKSGSSWTRVRLGSAVGLLLSRRGSLPLDYRRPCTPAIQTLEAGRPSYASVLLRGVSAMDGGVHGAGGNHAPFNGAGKVGFQAANNGDGSFAGLGGAGAGFQPGFNQGPGWNGGAMAGQGGTQGFNGSVSQWNGPPPAGGFGFNAGPMTAMANLHE